MDKAYKEKLLEVDLSSGSVKTSLMNEAEARAFIGGRGLGAKMLWDRTKPGMDPLGAETPLFFLAGPLTGVIPGGGQISLVFKSPATGITLGHPVIGAQWGSELKFAGYDGLIVTGKADKPVYLYIKDDVVEIRDAARLRGMDTIRTEVVLKRELKDPEVRVLCIGLAGENLVKFASIQTEYFHAFARGGSGCVMGSKNLKAIAVKGSGDIKVHSPKEFFAARAKFEDLMRNARNNSRMGYRLARWGSTVSSLGHHDISEMDVKNYREAHWPGIDKIGGLEFERRSKVKSRSCFSCPIACMQVGVIRRGRYAGTLVNPDFDSTGTIGPGCLLKDPEGLAFLNALGDSLGVDDASMGNVTSFAMECYEKGILTKNDLDGIDLKWGNVSAIEKLWRKIALREGVGNLFADGVREAAKKIGRGSEKFAMHVKGLEFAGYAPQAHHDRGLQYAVGDRGGCHHYGLTTAEQNNRALADSLTACSWYMVMHFVEPHKYIELLNAATGWEVQPADWNVLANRILTLSRMYNIREGMKPWQDDVLPARVFTEPLTRGPKAGTVYPREKFEKDRADWYKSRGYDEKGVPTEETLRQLSLQFCIEARRRT